MASLRLLLPTLASLAVLALAAPSLVTYVPECAQDCVLKSLNGTCTGPEDSQCLCTNMRTIGFGSVSCATAACNNSTELVASELRSGYAQFCTAAGASTPAGIPTGGVGWGSWGSSATAASTTGTTSMTTSSTSIPATGEADSPQNTSTSSLGGSGGGSSSLSTGAIAGVAVGGGIGLISITGGLLLLAFRLGRSHSRQKKDEAARQGPGQEGGGGDPDPESLADETAAGDKAQLEGKPVSELPTEYTLSGFDPIKELPTQERPAELSADPLPRYGDDGSPVLSGTPWR
ncbi:hypothetical protein F4781DRAFT_233972 [Annulohypoxylon bovei var. microspora]|nr:hypothetical protein F4781DRAFT_233972 [Annulohypoxylon bovei var. microspora]